MLAHLLPRRAIGRRGAVLSVVGAMWVLMGAGLILKGDPDAYAHLHLLVFTGVDDGWRGALIYGGIVAVLIIVAGWREPPQRCERRL